MMTLEQSLYALREKGGITQAQAIEQADSRTDLPLRIRLAAGFQPASGRLRMRRD